MTDADVHHTRVKTEIEDLITVIETTLGRADIAPWADDPLRGYLQAIAYGVLALAKMKFNGWS